MKELLQLCEKLLFQSIAKCSLAKRKIEMSILGVREMSAKDSIVAPVMPIGGEMATNFRKLRRILQNPKLLICATHDSSCPLLRLGTSKKGGPCDCGGAALQAELFGILIALAVKRK